jgi:hypothetical protein
MYEVVLIISLSLGLFASVVLLVNPGERRLLNGLLDSPFPCQKPRNNTR